LNEVEDRLECHEVALGEAEGSAMLAFNPENHGDHRIVAATGVRAGMRQVQVRTLDSFIDSSSEDAWLLWLDVQGFEPEVLAGASEAMGRGWPLVLEFTPDDLVAHGTLGKLIELLSRGQYTRFFDLDSQGPESAEGTIEDLQHLASKLSKEGTFTDLLFLRDAVQETRGLALD
jgi:hypothetical protein